VLADAEVEVVAGVGGGEVGQPLDQRLVGRRQVRRAAEQLRDVGRDGVEHLAGRGAGGDRLVGGLEGRQRGFPAVGELAGEAPLEVGRVVRMGSAVGLQTLGPLRLHLPAALARGVERHARRVGHQEGRLGGPAERLLGGDRLVRSERRAMRLGGAGLGRAAVADHGAHADQGGLFALAFGRDDRRLHRRQVVDVIDVQHAPAVRQEALLDVFAEREAGRAVEGDVVVVVEDLELGEPQMASEGGGLVADPFHQIAVARDDPDAIVEEREAVAVVAAGGEALGDRHADRVAETLAERAGGGLDAVRQLVLGMARRFGAPLAEALQLFHRQAIAAQMKERVEERRGVAAGEDKAVAVRPVRVLRVVPHVPRPQEIGQRSLAERRARMAGIGLLDHVHGQEADGVDRGQVVGALRLVFAVRSHVSPSLQVPPPPGGRP